MVRVRQVNQVGGRASAVGVGAQGDHPGVGDQAVCLFFVAGETGPVASSRPVHDAPHPQAGKPIGHYFVLLFAQTPQDLRGVEGAGRAIPGPGVNDLDPAVP